MEEIRKLRSKSVGRGRMLCLTMAEEGHVWVSERGCVCMEESGEDREMQSTFNNELEVKIVSFWDWSLRLSLEGCQQCIPFQTWLLWEGKL
jgi:hypothetical protein